ncbi:MAG TPA: hypothetical protein VFR85_00445 [Anaeromyxobacteraceae bacterium]|nr:hypothetical protein [Anaeromyxobacteraceae bacterium]
MRSRHLAIALLIALSPASALARSWQGITPGQSGQGDVTGRFGEPSTKGRLEGRTAMVYKGDQAIAGTRQAQFLVGEDGVVSEINVFPASQLDKESVEGTYGKGPQKTFTDDFRPVWIYRSAGVMVFFGKDGFVEAIRFKAPEGAGAAPAAAAKAPAASQAAPAAAAPPKPAPARPPGQ